jgi:hypothetical protein
MARVSVRQLVVTYTLPIALLAVALAACIRLNTSIWRMTGDTTAVAGVNPLTGSLSNVGILFWWTAAASCLFAGFILRRAAESESSRFMFAAGGLTAWLAIDDFFLLHERIGPSYLGIPEDGVYLMLMIATAAYLWRWRESIRGNGILMLHLGLTFFVLSMFADKVLSERLPAYFGIQTPVVEDGLKLLGIASWCSFHCRAAYMLVIGVTVEETVTAAVPGGVTDKPIRAGWRLPAGLR